MNIKEISIINSNSILDLPKGVIYSIFENTLNFIKELEEYRN